MKNKRGLSQIVTTIILILLIIMAIASIWIVVDRLILQGTSKINLEQFTINLKIVSAKINYSSGIAEVRVKRNPGEGNLTGIKFIVEDSRTSEVFEKRFVRFEEFAEKTFDIDLLISESNLVIFDIEKISIAPIYVAGSGTSESLGSISDSISGIKELNLTGLEGGEIEGGIGSDGECVVNLDCGEDYFIEGTKTCDILGNVVQYKKTFECVGTICINPPRNVLIVIESCPLGYSCSEGICIKEDVFCTVETVIEDCGAGRFTGQKNCDADGIRVLGDYQEFMCIDSICISETSPVIIEDCEEGEICEEGECFVPEDCITNRDCWGGSNPNGYVCTLGNCTLEKVLENGTVRSVWPFGIGEYFDSFDLPLESANISVGQYIIFPESSQTGCLTIEKFVTPDFEEGISYIKFYQSPTNVSDGDNFEIWETEYVCQGL